MTVEVLDALTARAMGIRGRDTLVVRPDGLPVREGAVPAAIAA